MNNERINASGQKLGKLVLQGLASCALGEISGLVKYRDAPDRAMRDFYLQSKHEHPVIIVFCGVVKNTVGTGDLADEWCNGCKYSQQFTAFIRQNKMGEVIEGVERENINHHRGHFIRVYTWAPDYAAITAWYNETGSKITDRLTL